MHLNARNYNTLAPTLYTALARGIPQDSRNGPVLRLPGTVMMTVERPRERVNVWPERDANPFFHLMEALAMLAAHNSVDFLAHFAKNMRLYSDDGARYNAFYGERLRHTWGDQLSMVIEELESNPESRQAVAQIWDPQDLHRTTKDKACNLLLQFDTTAYGDGRLNMTSFNRSNDAVWGIGTGANVVHLSMFQEYVACALGLEVGRWTHTSANLHVYTQNPQWLKVYMASQHQPFDLYQLGGPVLSPVLFAPGGRDSFDAHLRIFVDTAHAMITEQEVICYPDSLWADVERDAPFIAGVAVPMFNAWQLRKRGHHDRAREALRRVTAKDWGYAAKQWVARRGVQHES